MASYRRADLLLEFLAQVPPDVGIQFDVAGLDLSRTDWSGRLFLGMSFTDCNLDEAKFNKCAIADVAFNRCSLADAEFRDATVDSLVFSGGVRIFGTPDAFDELETRGADCGLTSEARAVTVRREREQRVVGMVRDRLYRFYRPGQAGPEGSRWDSSIKENNLFGGVAPQDRKFAKKKLIPALRSAGLISARRAHGEVIYDLDNDGEDDARVLIERNEVRGRCCCFSRWSIRRRSSRC